MQPVEPPRTAVRRRPPASAVVAAVLGILSAVVPAVVGFLALAFSTEDDVLALVVGVPLALILWLLVGAGLLLAGRSWLVLGLPTGFIAVLMWAGTLLGGIGGGPYGFGPLSVVVPTVVAALCVLPSTRHWVAARRAARRA